MKKNYVWLVSLLFIFAGIGCKSKKFGKKKQALPLEEITSETAIKAQKEDFTFDFLSMRARANYTEGSTNQNFTLNIRMKADSVVWISATGLGFEVARAIFLKDSVFVIDRFNKTYYAYDYNYAKAILHTDINLHQLQQLMVGNSPFDIKTYKEKKGEVKGPYFAHQLEKVLSEVILNNLLRPSESILKSLIEARTLTATYTNHNKVDKKWLPYQVDVRIITENSKPELSLSISDVNTKAIDDFPFSIPSKYSKGN